MFCTHMSSWCRDNIKSRMKYNQKQVSFLLKRFLMDLTRFLKRMITESPGSQTMKNRNSWWTSYQCFWNRLIKNWLKKVCWRKIIKIWKNLWRHTRDVDKTPEWTKIKGILILRSMKLMEGHLRFRHAWSITFTLMSTWTATRTRSATWIFCGRSKDLNHMPKI